MDDLVQAAIGRWPKVPAAYGWLSLSRRGQWMLHPHGQGWGTSSPTPGEPITNPQIINFIGRNYQSDALGQWFFQNGPQRVFVGLDGAPWVLHTQPGPNGLPQLFTHTGLAYPPPQQWWLSPDGQLYTQSPLGAGLILDRDLIHLIDLLSLADGRSLIDILEASSQPSPAPVMVQFGGKHTGWTAPLGWLDSPLPARPLGFVRHPQPAAQT